MRNDDIRWDLYPHVAQNPHASAFVEWLLLYDRRPKTVDAYARTIDDLLVAFRGTDADRVIEADETDILRYIAALKQRPSKRRVQTPAVPTATEDHVVSLTRPTVADATIAQRVVAIRRFYDFLIRQRVRADGVNPLPRGSDGRHGQPPARGPVRLLQHLPWTPPDDMWERIVLHTATHESARNRAMIFLAYDAALRREELMRLRADDIDWDRALLTIRAETSKSGRTRIVPFSGFTESVLKAYLTTDRQVLVDAFGAEQHGPLFLSESTANPGKPLALGAFNDVVEALRTQLALPHLRPHTLRHHRLTTLKRAKIPLDDIALFAGHKSTETTRLYLHIAPTDLGALVRERSKPFDALIEQALARQAR